MNYSFVCRSGCHPKELSGFGELNGVFAGIQKLSLDGETNLLQQISDKEIWMKEDKITNRTLGIPGDRARRTHRR